MRIKSDHALQFKVKLEGGRPPIWRRIQILCDATFWDLHVAIQDAMGWFDRHLHEFRLATRLRSDTPCIGIPDDEFPESDPVFRDTWPGWEIPVSALLNLAMRKAIYTYDFGDGWEHTVVLEKILPREPDTVYPRCVGGRRACPPEDCGGIPGYEELLEVLADPDHPQREERLSWVGPDFDPDRFDKDTVVFDDPVERWTAAFADDPSGGEEEFGPYLDVAAIVDRAGKWESGPGLTRSTRDLVAAAARGFRGFPVGTVALYGPDDRRATKIAAAVMRSPDMEPDPVRRWSNRGGDPAVDIRRDESVAREVSEFFASEGVKTVILSDGIMGCPHEEGVDYPIATSCPYCPFWSSREPGTGETLH